MILRKKERCGSAAVVQWRRALFVASSAALWLGEQQRTAMGYAIISGNNDMNKPYPPASFAKRRRTTTTQTQTQSRTHEEEREETQTRTREAKPLLPPATPWTVSWKSSSASPLLLLPPYQIHDDEKEQLLAVEQRVEWLEFKLLDQGFSPMDMQQVSKTMKRLTAGNVGKLSGMVDFLQLLLSLQPRQEQSQPQPQYFQKEVLTKEFIMASVIHYAECIDEDSSIVQQHDEPNARQPTRRLAEVSGPGMANEDWLLAKEDNSIVLEYNVNTSSTQVRIQQEPPSGSSAIVHVGRKKDDNAAGRSNAEVSRIVKGAERLHKAEHMARSILAEHYLSQEEASRLRDLLLSVMDDWRSLGIRAVACLFKLQRILQLRYHNASLSTRATSKEYQQRSREDIRTAREALRVFAPLAQRLAMHHLKAKLEDCAFQVLYRRQYTAASALYETSTLKAMSRHVEGQIAHVLMNDKQLMSQLQELQITSRVKEPYSAWRKLVKKKFSKLASSEPIATTAAAAIDTTTTISSSGTTNAITLAATQNNTEDSSHLSELPVISSIQDSVALRVILRARKYTDDEPEEKTRERERFLCYYVQRLIQSQFPLLDNHQVKDYIRYPKQNGYQSLHYNSYLSSQGKEWPFEVQVRSEEMHRRAEFGVAAHWDYKLGSNTDPTAVLAPHSSPSIEKQSLVIPTTPTAGKSYIDALVTAKDALVQNKVFCFFGGNVFANGKGQLLSLPVGAKVGDALKELTMGEGSIDALAEGTVGSILKNGHEASLTDVVNNGDVLLLVNAYSSKAS